jgi:hypothetical protein
MAYKKPFAAATIKGVHLSLYLVFTFAPFLINKLMISKLF